MFLFLFYCFLSLLNQSLSEAKIVPKSCRHLTLLAFLSTGNI
jgi:hypothetical protein